MILEKMIKQENVKFLKESTQEAVLRNLASFLYTDGFVNESYIEAILLREHKFPTGLQTEHFGIAIPHTDSIHVNTATIGVGILNTPVSFSEMGNEENSVEVQIVFMLAIKDPDKQLEVLQAVIELIQDSTKISQMLASKDAGEVADIICGRS